MLRRAALAVVSLASILAVGDGCFTTENPGVGTAAQTLITVDPATFRGDLACGPFPGAMQTYVATLTDVTSGFPLASSGPTPCNLAVSFAFVVPGHAYVAAIDAYDRADLVPRGGPGSGSPIMLDPTTQAVVAPTWTTRCGAAAPDAAPDAEPDAAPDAEPDAAPDAAPPPDGTDAPTYSEAYRDMKMRGCQPIFVGTTGSVSIDLSGARGPLACAGDGGDAGEAALDHVVVTPRDASLGARTAACDDVVTYDGLASSRTYLFDVAAYAPGATSPGWSSHCHVFTAASATLPASCTPFDAQGSIRVAIAPLVAEADAGGACVAYTVSIAGKGVVVSGSDCASDAVVDSLAPGSYDLTVDALGASPDGGAAPLFTATCSSVKVSAGQTTDASCTL